MREYLVCYDYGTGGLWWWIEAENAAAISAKYANVEVFEEPPAWWTEETDRHVRHLRLSDSPAPALAGLLRS